MKAGTSVAWLGAALAASCVFALSAQAPANDGPKYAPATNNLIAPADYREWIFLSSSLGLDYRAVPPGTPPGFGNVFVNPSSYRAFKQTGKWPDKTILVLEFHASGKETIKDREGRFQAAFTGFEAEVKDARFPAGWAYYGGLAAGRPAAPLSGDPEQTCIDCHTKNTAVERTFVQFYPTLLEVAKKMGTVKATYGEP